MLSGYDHIVIAFYLLFMIGMSLVFKRFIHNTSDYFRSGGQMLWWIVGAGAFMTNFSAVTFTGMAGKAYDDGPVVLTIFIGCAIGFFFNYIYFAAVFRQMRCVTAMQAVRNRFGPFNEQFFTWLQIPTGMLYAGIWLNGIAVFVAAAFGLPLNWTIVIAGSIVVLMAVVGGSWSTTASEFVQMLLLMPVTLVAAIAALNRVGGVTQFVQHVPKKFWHWGEAANSNLIVLWVIAMLLQKWTVINNMTDASRYLSVKDTVNAKKAALLGMILFIIGPAIWFIPPMAARITHPDLHAVFPALPNPQEASYFAIAIQTLPKGMIGLLLCGIFSATMSSMDSGLNRNAGYFVKNCYQIGRPKATERELMIAAVITTLLLGGMIIAIGLLFASWKDLTIFRLMVNFGAWVGLPLTLPLIFGMFIRRAPAWSGWSTVLISLTTSWLVNRYLDASWCGRLLGFNLNAREASDWAQTIGILVVLVVGSAWFCITPFLVRRRSPDEVAQVDHFFEQMHSPVDFTLEQGAGTDNLQAKVMGSLCLIYGGFILVLILIPNSMYGRLAFAFCGAIMFGVGAMLIRASESRSPIRESHPQHAEAITAGAPATNQIP